MSVRNKFLENFKLISAKFAERIAVYQIWDLEKSSGFTYFEFERVSNELSDYFLKVFETTPQYVGTWLNDYKFLPVIILGIWKSGGAFAGIGTQYTTQNNLDYLNFLKIKYLITDKEDNTYGDEIISQFCVCSKKFFIWRRQCQSDRERLSGIWDICYGIMTSGSTGMSKIIQVPWSCILPNVEELSDEFQIDESDCIFQASPYTFDPFFVEFLLPLLTGCSLMIVSDFIKLFPSNLLTVLFQSGCKLEKETSDCLCSSDNPFCVNLKHIRKKNITILQMTPSIFKRWKDEQIRNLILSSNTSLKVLLLGGERFPNDILGLRSSDNKTRIFNIYGITEISCWAFINELTNKSVNDEVSIGRPLKDITYKISEGELEIGSKTRVCLVNEDSPFVEAKTVFRNTGDVVKLIDGELQFMTRTNDIVKRYGIKISLNKIERIFLNVNKSMKECCCVYDEPSKKLGLFYVIDDEIAKIKESNYLLIKEEDFLKRGLSKPKDKLRDIEQPDYLVEMSEFPLNSHGKRDKKKLIENLREIQESPSKRKPEEDSRKTLEEIVWSVLGFKETISRTQFHKSFQDLGGNSVSALLTINRLQDSGIEVPRDFIGELLGNGSLESCLELLSSGGVRKRAKVDGGSFKVQDDDGDDGMFVRWRFDLEKCVDATPAVVMFQGSERIIVGSHSSKLCCLNAETGTEIWTISLGDRIESGFAATKDGSRGFIGCYDHFVYSILVADGSVLWKYKTGEMVKSTPCLSRDEDVVYVASYDQCLHCVSSLDGKLVKRIKISEGAGIYSSGLISQSYNALYIGTLDGTCLSLNLKSNEITWKTKLKSPVFASPNLLSNESKVVFAEVVGVVHSLDALTGVRMWVFEAQGNIYSSPVVQTIRNITRVVFGCHDGHLYCLQDGESCELKWKRQLDSPVFARPCVFAMGSEDQTVCAATIKGFIYLCDLVFGSVSNQLKLRGEVFSSPVRGRNGLFVGCRDNYLYALEIGKRTEVPERERILKS